MPKPDASSALRNIDRRLSNVEQVLPTLATKEQVREEAVETRRHFDVVAESLRGDIRLIAEGHVHPTHRMDKFEADTKGAVAGLDRRVLRLEASAVDKRSVSGLARLSAWPSRLMKTNCRPAAAAARLSTRFASVRLSRVRERRPVLIGPTRPCCRPPTGHRATLAFRP